MRVLRFIPLVAALCGIAHATTLEQLPLPDMARQSTEIVRAKVIGSTGVRKGADVYTVYRIEVAETWKRSMKSRV